MNSRSDLRVFTVIAIAMGMSVVVMSLLWQHSPAVQSHDMAVAAFIAPLIVAGRLFPLQVAFRRRTMTDTAPLVAACLMLPPQLAALTALCTIAPAEVISGMRGTLYMRQVVFNSCQAMLGVAAGAVVFGVAGGDLDTALSSPSGFSALLGATLAMFAVNDLLVFSVVWAQMGLTFRRMVWDYARGRVDLLHDVALYSAGAIAAIAAEGTPGILWLLAAPLPVFHRAMRDHISLRMQTREAVIALADTVDDRDPYTFGHCRRVAEFSERICKEMGLSPDLTDEIVLAARVHDVGKIGIRDAVLLKPGRLTDEEYDHIKEHPEIGARLTARFPDFARGTKYIRHHHERWDGAGYPSGLKGKEIPMGARIISVADTYDAITSTRVYREAKDDRFAAAEMVRVAGTQLDPEVVAAWVRLMSWEQAMPGPEEATSAEPAPDDARPEAA